jgi:HK97 family phage major capsid protein/HK97 family phage prohead protease
MARSRNDLFVVEDHRLQDAKLHAAILENGNAAAAQKVGDDVAKTIGLTPAEITALHAPLGKGRSPKRAAVPKETPMPLKPAKDESQEQWMARCVPEMMGESGGTKRPQEQAVAACSTMWNDAHPKSGGATRLRALEDDAPDPDDDESEEDFIDRCVDQLTDDGADEDDAQEACQLAWDSRSAKNIRRKTHAEDVHGMEFILSDETIDRMGDVIASDGWDLKAFKQNPIALFNHRSDFPIGKWSDLRVEKKSLRGKLQLAPEGTSDRIDELRRLIDAGILRAVSVGFRDIESEAIDKKNPFSGYRFLKQELIETSLVSVPANPNALAIAKSLNVSPQTLDLVFAKHGKRGATERRGFIGKHAETTRTGRKGSDMTLAQRIIDIEAQLVERRDALQKHIDHVDDTNVSDADLETTQKFNADIAQLERQRAALADSEKALAGTADNGNGASRALVVDQRNGGSTGAGGPRKKKELDPLDYIVRAAMVGYFVKTTGRQADVVRQKIYGDDEPTKGICEIILRAASAPAMTTVTGWAAELVQQIYTDFMQLLYAKSILPRLAARGLTLNFGQAGRIIIPTRSRTPTIAGSFVGEGMAIPVRQGAFTSQTLTPKKVAVISTWTKEMNDHSIPAIEGLIREAVQIDTSVAIDTVLIDSNAATVIRPPGLLNGVASLTPTAGGGLTALVGDIKLLIQALVASTYGNIREPAWLMNPGDVLSASLANAPNTGIFPFRDEIKGGTLNNIPIIDSATVAPKQMILVDAADFVVVGGEAPRLELSDQATLHMEDTAPLDLVGPGSPGVVAAPQRSLFQTDSIALRMVMPLNWVQRRAGTIAWTTATTWS